MGRVSPWPLVHPSSPHSSCVLSTSPVSSTMLSLETEGQTRRHPRCTFLLRDPCLRPSSLLQETVTGTDLPSRLDSHPMRYPYCHGPRDDDCATDPLGNTIMCAGRVLVCWGRVGGSSHCSGSWTVEGREHHVDLKGMWVWARLPGLKSWLSAPLGKSLCLSRPWSSLSVE